MLDKEGNPQNSCDCPLFKKMDVCLHSECIERFVDDMPPPIVTGEDPEADIVSMMRNNHLFFSVATKSGSETRQNQKRTIVQRTGDGQWKCKSCPK